MSRRVSIRMTKQQLMDYATSCHYKERETKKKLRQAEINKKSAKTRHENALSRANRGRQTGYRLADVMCDIIINVAEPDWDSVINGYESMNYEYEDIKETIEYIYGDSVPVDLPEPCTKHGYNHPDNCYECEEDKE